MRDTNLKRTTRGYVRNLGRVADGSQPKFYLGHDRNLALKRLEQITALWLQLEAAHGSRPGKPVWNFDYLEAAKAIAKGEAATLAPKNFQTGNEQPSKYFERISSLQRSGIDVSPKDSFTFDLGRADLSSNVISAEEELERVIGPKATGQNLHEAMRAYQNHIAKEYRNPENGTITDNGKTKIDQVKSIMTYLPDQDLGSLDYSACDELFAIFRRRPISKRYGKPMKRKTCTNYIGELGRFFRWLHLDKTFRWRKPEDFESIKRRPNDLEEDVEHESADVQIWSIDELATLYKYALPIERLFFLLGLNCAYGADQAGRLRHSHLRLGESGKHSFIRRIRRKKKTISRHILWKPTAEGLRWALEHRGVYSPNNEFVMVNKKGQPYWRLTAAGNRSQQIPNLWNRLLDRVQKDHPDFRRLAFNSLRDTSANFIRRLGGEETASLHLAHKHQSKDENLNRYTNPVRGKHFKSTLRLEEKLQRVFLAGGETPWVQQPKNYIGLKQIEEIKRLNSVGLKASEIAKETNLSIPTVIRHLSKTRNP